MKLIRFHIRSLSPGMLQNPATPELLESLRTKTPAAKKTDITLKDDAAAKMYRSEPGEDKKPGKMGIPMQNIMACMVIAGRQVKSGKKALSTAKDTQIFGFLEFVEDFCPFKDCDANGNIEWNPFPVKGTMHNGASEVAVCINRPRIPKWELAFTVKFDDKRNVDEKTLQSLVETAGRQVGLGDWRPAKRGRFGRFTVVKMEVLDLKVKEEKIEVVRFEGDLAENAPEELKMLAGLNA
jgi:hypothetical protein